MNEGDATCFLSLELSKTLKIALFPYFFIKSAFSLGNIYIISYIYSS